MNNELLKYKDIIKPMMSKKRYVHCCNVAEMCVKLAKIHGFDEDKAYTAGILHDIRKEIDYETMEKEMLASGFYIDPAEHYSKKTWHGIASAYYAANVLGITDTDILNAIRFHTVGRPKMSKLEKIVYLGDLVSAERDFKDVEMYREYTLKNLDNAMFRVLEWSIPNTISKGGKIPVSTIEAYNYYMDFSVKSDNS